MLYYKGPQTWLTYNWGHTHPALILDLLCHHRVEWGYTGSILCTHPALISILSPWSRMRLVITKEGHTTDTLMLFLFLIISSLRDSANPTAPYFEALYNINIIYNILCQIRHTLFIKELINIFSLKEHLMMY